MANRSTAGVEAGRLHPAVSAKSNKSHRTLLCMFGFDGFKITLLTGQDFCAETPASRAADFFLNGPIYLEAGHALHFGRYKTDVQLCLFRVGAFTEFPPLRLKRGEIKFGEFAEGQQKAGDPRPSICLNTAKYLIKNGSSDLQFAHVALCEDNE